MRLYLDNLKIRDIIIEDLESQGYYVDKTSVRFEIRHGMLAGCSVITVPNPMCTHTCDGESTLREVNGEFICPICGLKFAKNKI